MSQPCHSLTIVSAIQDLTLQTLDIHSTQTYHHCTSRCPSTGQCQVISRHSPDNKVKYGFSNLLWPLIILVIFLLSRPFVIIQDGWWAIVKYSILSIDNRYFFWLCMVALLSRASMLNCLLIGLVHIFLEESPEVLEESPEVLQIPSLKQFFEQIVWMLIPVEV